MPNITMPNILEVTNLTQHFSGGKKLFGKGYTVQALDGVDFEIKAGQTLGLVGESGCGKSTLGRALLQLYQPTAGEIKFGKESVMGIKGKKLKQMRQNMQIILQDPAESLNPRHTIEMILEEPYIIHGLGTDVERKVWVRDLIQKVGLPLSALSRYPHEFSGGQKQRIGIARAIALEPKLIVCDESVSALDVSVQAQIINLLLDLQADMGLTLLFISHDLSVVRHVSDQIAVMYLGEIVEYGDAQTIYQSPRHPYTQALISAIPISHPSQRGQKQRVSLKGELPSPINPPQGCRFASRCPKVMPHCRHLKPDMQAVGQDQCVSCFLYEVAPMPKHQIKTTK